VKTELLRIERLAKSFVGVEALYNVNLNIFKGEILGLLGLNGSGKSAVVEVLGGIHPKDRGRIFWNEQEVNITTPTDAQHLGIHCILQTSKLVPNLSLAENVLVLSRAKHQRLVVSQRHLNQEAQHILAQVGLALPPQTLARTLSPLERHLVEIAKALHEGAALIVLDDVTDEYNPSDFETLKAVLERVRARGVSVLIVSRDLNSITDMSDRITVLRDGTTVRTLHRDEYAEQTFINLLAGYRFNDTFVKSARTLGAEALRLENVKVDGLHTDGIDLTLQRGEVLSVLDLQGTSAVALAQIVCGERPLTSGAMFVRGKPFHPRNLRDALAQGIGLLPEDGLGTLFDNMDVSDNLSFLIYRKIAKLSGHLNTRMQRFLLKEYLPRQDNEAAVPAKSITQLDKNDQLRVLMYRWLIRKPEVLVMVRPTLGIDLITRKTLYPLMDELAQAGIAILLISSELSEAVTNGDRVLLIRDGKPCGIYTHEQIRHLKIDQLI